MNKYKKVFDAIQYTKENCKLLHERLGFAHSGLSVCGEDNFYFWDESDGHVYVTSGDWVLIEANGKIHRCSDEEFKREYVKEE